MKFLYKLNYYYYKFQFNVRQFLSQLFLCCAGKCAYGGEGEKRVIQVINPYGENITYDFKNSLVQKNEAAIFDGTLIILNNMEILRYDNAVLENLITQRTSSCDIPGVVYPDIIAECVEQISINAVY